jgi:hypothetical protein
MGSVAKQVYLFEKKEEMHILCKKLDARRQGRAHTRKVGTFILDAEHLSLQQRPRHGSALQTRKKP